jgi:hypothetical protein
MSSLAASQSGGTPDVELTGSRTSSGSGIPDEVDIFRDGARIARLAGVDVFYGSAFRWVDQMPPMARPVTYRVAPRVNGKTAAGGPEVVVTPLNRGIWLTKLDADDNPTDRLLLWSEDKFPEQTAPENSIVHAPLRRVDGEGQVVRRRMVRFRPQGTVAGVIMDPPSSADGLPDAATCEALLRDWADDDAGDRYWLTYSGFTGTVIIGDVEFGERDNPRQDRGRMVNVSFNYWGQA